MGFIQTQILIFATIIIASLLAGKKGAVMSIAVWLVETIIVIKVNNLLEKLDKYQQVELPQLFKED